MDNGQARSLLKAGDRFGDYIVERLLGKGGMGAVFLVRTESGSRYAVKVMYPDMMSHDMRVRFAREAKFAMDVRHRNLISVYDVGEDPDTGLCYIIMDYVPGGSLSDKLKAAGRLPVQEAVSIVTQVASGLDAAHRRGLVHRDVKPDNILFDADGTPKLADLGVAKLEGDSRTVVTMSGEIIGTPAYMSPEQLMDSHSIDARADIYALGVVLYEMLTGRRPNEGSSTVELLAKALKGEPLPDIRTMRPEVSASIAYALSRMCDAKPDNRPATALEAAKLLQRAATGKFDLKRKPPMASVAMANGRRATLKKAFFTSLATVWVGFCLLAIGAAMFGLFIFLRNESTAPHKVVVTNVVEKVKVVTNEVEHAAAATGEKSNAPTGQPANARHAATGADKPHGVAGARVMHADGEASESPQPVSDTKAVGPFNRTVLFPTLDRSPAAWAYSFEEEAGWKNPNFNDQAWRRAPGGFGRRDNGGQRHARINTIWQTSRIFLRRHFSWDGGKVTRAVVDLYHDDDVGIYLNGRLLLAINWANGGWQPFEIPLERFTQALKRGDNVVCVEVRNRGKSQYFDCGLLVEYGGELATPAGIDGVRKVKTAAGTWTVKVRDGVAQIGDGENVALDPRPTGRLVIPSELDGLQIRKLAGNCFAKCGDLESVTIPEGVFSVGPRAFINCQRLVEMSIPDSLEHFAFEALCGTGLKGIDLKNVRLIEDGVFKFCTKLNDLAVNPGNLTYFVKDGVLYDKMRRAIAFCPRSCDAFVIPDGTEEIYDSAFQKTQLMSVVFPETVEIVGHDAFGGCPFLESVKFRGQDAILGKWAFGRTPSLKTVILPSRLKELDAQSIFNGAGELESISLPDTLEVIGDDVFADCGKLRSISLGKSLRMVRNHAFSDCLELQAVVFPDTLEGLGAEVFLNCKSLETVSFLGNAPKLMDQGGDKFGKDLYRGTDPSLMTLVRKDSTGWLDETSALPEHWPVDGGVSARPIEFGSGRQFSR